jgi:PTH1 family peptidyl-tRNA hydrolase
VFERKENKMSDIFDIFKRISAEREAVSSEPITHLIVGLGNTGKKYENTRHNAGFLMADYIASRTGVSVRNAKFKGLCAEVTFNIEYTVKPKKSKKKAEGAPVVEEQPTVAKKTVRALLIKPETLMNRSGICVEEAASFYKIKPENIIVIYDDISLPVGKLRVRRKGSAGGHNGIKSITGMLGSENYPRIKLGVGEKPHPEYDLADWVLSSFSAKDREGLEEVFPVAYEGLLKMLVGDIDGAMAICN